MAADSNYTVVHGMFISGKTYTSKDGGKTWELYETPPVPPDTSTWMYLPTTERERQLEAEIAALRTELRGHEQLLKVTEGAFERLLTEARADVDAANARAAAAERERDALMQATRAVVGEFDYAPADYSGAWEIVPSAESLNALYALLYPVTAQPADGSAAE